MSGVPYLFINVAALGCFVILLATFLAAKKTPEIHAFLLLLADCVLWLGSTVFMRLQLWPGTRFWFFASLMALFAIEWFYYLFLLWFTRQKEPFTFLTWTILTLVELVITPTGFFLQPPVPSEAEVGTVFLYTMNWHIILICVFHLLFSLYLVKLVRKVVREQGIRSPGLLLVLLGGGLMALGNVLQIGLPGNTFPYDALCGIIFAEMMMIALYKKRMFRMTLVVSRSLLILILALICAACSAYIITPLQQFLTSALHLSVQAAIVMVSILMAGALFFAYLLVKRMTDALFTREEQQDRLLKQFSAEVSQTLNTAEIMEKLSAVIMAEIPTEQLYVCLLEDDRYVARYSSSPLASLSFSISKDSPQIAYLQEQETYLVVSEFRSNPLYLSVWESEKELLRRLNIDCVVALRSGKSVGGVILLAAKDRGRTYSYMEISFLETVSSLSSIAMKNASLYEKMFREARIDALTGVYNYRYFVELEEGQFRLCRDDCLTLMFVDVDDFKLYNQLYGVGEGDNALCRISECITHCAGAGGTVFRTSGKVFAVLLPHQDARSAKTMAEEIERRISLINDVPERRHMKPLSVSIGLCSAPYAASSAKELLDNTDLATYNAKEGGKSRVVVFRGVSDALPQRLAERTDAVVDRIERDGGEYRMALSMISALTAAIDAKDHYTYAHSKNVARYAANLAVAAGLNDEQVRTIYAAGLLHDIGKISIPEDILNKSGKLSSPEYEQMKDHVNSSIEMIRHLPEMDYVIPGVLGHHERWDGKGYPRGIRGEEIPVSARCLSIADVFDAMTTDRPYRQGLPLEYVIQELSRGAGTQFDPHLTAIFIQQLRSREIPLASQVHS